ncbi:MAG: hypothetical protein ACK52I_15135 [Pseudomonadota bacterium]|jgi:hypothetical protein
MESNLPDWPGADGAYRRTVIIIANMAKAGHIKRIGRGEKAKCEVSADLQDYIEAMNKGDEERIKALNHVWRKFHP